MATEFRAYDVIKHSANKVLKLSDLMKIHIMDVSGGNRKFTLPKVGTPHIGLWVILVKDGTNNLEIRAQIGDAIDHGATGGYLEHNDGTEDIVSQFLVVVKSGQWLQPSFGTWDLY